MFYKMIICLFLGINCVLVSSLAGEVMDVVNVVLADHHDMSVVITSYYNFEWLRPSRHQASGGM